MAKKERVLLGMSGGVDSSVCAALLQRQGYQVIGITMQLLPPSLDNTGACCNRSAVCDAQRVAHSLGIPHYVINARETFQTHVIDPFVSRYMQGETPNPCIECNRSIKFDAIREAGRSLGTQWVATGHYVRRLWHTRRHEYGLYTALDPQKDQSYFLYPMTQSGLAHTLFPLGRYTKSTIRQMAHSFQLLTATKPDSQDICFVKKGAHAEFVARQHVVPPTPGLIVHVNGTVLGHHQGIHRYTIGQRKGLNISASTPLYVVRIDAPTHTVVVGPVDKGVHVVTLRQPTLVSASESPVGNRYTVKLRSQMTPQMATVTAWQPDRATLSLYEPIPFVSPGQSAVLYHGSRVVGGGIIQLEGREAWGE